MLSSSLRSVLFMSCFVYGSYAKNAYTKGLLPVTKFRTKSYFFSENLNATYINANKICNELGMQLISIPNQEVNNFLLYTITAFNKARHYWTSGTDIIVSRSWIWLTAAQPVTYTSWAPNQPDGLSEQCIEVWPHNQALQWNNLDCETELDFICESRDGNNLEEPTTNIQCTSNSIQIQTPSFYIGKENVNYDTAIEKCEDRGQMLVSIENEAKQEAVDKFIKESGYEHYLWISGKRLTEQEIWRWITGHRVKYFNWKPMQPNNRGGSQECMIIMKSDSGSSWSDIDCENRYHYICESEPFSNA